MAGLGFWKVAWKGTKALGKAGWKGIKALGKVVRKHPKKTLTGIVATGVAVSAVVNGPEISEDLRSWLKEGISKDLDAGKKDGITAQVKDRAALAQEVRNMVAPYTNEAIDKATKNATFMNQITKDLLSMGYISSNDRGPVTETEGFKEFWKQTGIELTTKNGKVVLDELNNKAIGQGIIQARMPGILKTLGYTKDNISVKDVYNSDNISTENLNKALDTWKKQNPQASTAQKPKGAEMKEMLAGATVTELPNGLTLYQAKGRGGMGA